MFEIAYQFNSIIVNNLLLSFQTGVAYSKHIVQLYTYFGGNDIRQYLEVGSHILSLPFIKVYWYFYSNEILPLISRLTLILVL